MKSRISMTAVLLTAAIMAQALPATAAPVAGNGLYNPRDYIEMTAAPVTFSKTEVAAAETFKATVKNSGTCFKDSPAPTTAARYTYKYVAEHKASGTKVTLNPSFAVTINPLPQKMGESYSVSNDAALQFPSGSVAGEYRLTEEVTFVEILIPGADWQEAPFPTKPAAPIQPAAPTAPTAPSAPTDTTQPRTTEPTAPTAPTEPTKPAEPQQPQRIREIGIIKLAVAATEAVASGEESVTDEDNSRVATHEALEVASVSVAPVSVVGGGSATVKVTLNQTAPAGGQAIGMTVSAAAGVLARTAPASLTVKEGESAVSFEIATRSVNANSTVYVRAKLAASGKVVTAILTVTPKVSVSSLAFSPSAVVAGTTATGKVTLNRAAPAGGLTLSLAASPASVLTLPATVTVEAGKTTASFAIPTKAVPTTKYVNVKISQDRSVSSAQLVVMPLTVSSLSLSPSAVIGGMSATGRVVLNGPAPAGGQKVLLSAASHSALSLPSSVTVEAGKAFGTFTVQTRGLTRTASLTVRASLNNSYRTASFTINPLTLSMLSVSPASVMGGATLAGRISLSGLAPAGGQTVQLAASPSSALTVPSSVTVPEGKAVGDFTIQTKAVSRSTSATVRATLGSSFRTVSLTVLKPSAKTAPQGDLASTSATLAATDIKMEFLTCTLAAGDTGSRVRAIASGTATGAVGTRVELPILIWSDDKMNCGDWSYHAGALVAVGSTCTRKEGQPETMHWTVDTGGEEQGDWLRGKTRSYTAKIYKNSNLTPEREAKASVTCR